MMNEGVGPLQANEGILLQGGRMLLLFDRPGPLPSAGRILTDERMTVWHAASWQSAGVLDGWMGLALVDSIPAANSVLVCEGGERVSLLPPASVDLVPDALVRLARTAELDAEAIFAFLVRHLLDGRPLTCEIARAHRAFARSFLVAASEPAGFIEIVAQPDCGGLFLQGWSISLEAGTARITSTTEDLALREVEIAVFDRSDVLPPARGCCIFGKDWDQQDLASLSAVFFERNGKLARLDVVPNPVLHSEPSLATEHVRGMLPRLEGGQQVLRAFRRICRPRYGGTDTLSPADIPVAAAIDVLLQAPDGALLIAGWVLDPLRRVEMAILKSTGGLYVPLHRNWTRIPRPDVVAGFVADPRFAHCLDPGDAMYGFVVHALSARVTGSEAYLELVLEDGALFLPLRIAPALSADNMTRVLPALAPPEPEFDEIVARHLAPFVASLAPGGPTATHGPSPIRLGSAGVRPITAIMPLDRLSDLQPVLGLLGGSSDARDLNLTLVLPRTLARESSRRIKDVFDFYGLNGALVVVSDSLPSRQRLDAGLRVTTTERILAWQPSVLPQAHGWLDALLDESESLTRASILSPALIYEDGSIYFAGEPGASRDYQCGRLGYGRLALEAGASRQVAAAAAEIALVDREALVAAGGFAGRLLSGLYGHVDLSRRLNALGIASWCSGSVRFWKLDDTTSGELDHADRILVAIDEAMLERPAATPPEFRA